MSEICKYCSPQGNQPTADYILVYSNHSHPITESNSPERRIPVCQIHISSAIKENRTEGFGDPTSLIYFPMNVLSQRVLRHVLSRLEMEEAASAR